MSIGNEMSIQNILDWKMSIRNEMSIYIYVGICLNNTECIKKTAKFPVSINCFNPKSNLQKKTDKKSVNDCFKPNWNVSS